jgi:hypothetical protein
MAGRQGNLSPVYRCRVAQWPAFLDTLLWLQLSLRTSVSTESQVQWTLDDAGDLTEHDIGLVEHLPPPQGDHPLCRLWRDNHQFGALFCRKGPGLLSVTDRRSRFPRARYTLRGERVAELLADTVRPAGDPRLADAGLTIARGGYQVFLPCRLKNPPVPFLRGLSFDGTPSTIRTARPG